MSVTLGQFFAQSGTDPGLVELLLALATGCERINAAVRRGAVGGVLGALESQNVQGEVQKKLDVLSNDILVEACAGAPALVGMVSEEMDDVHAVRSVRSRKIPQWACINAKAASLQMAPISPR